MSTFLLFLELAVVLAMRPYIDIVDSIKAESMTKFNNLL